MLGVNEFNIFEMQCISVRGKAGTLEENLKWLLREWNRRYCRNHE